MSKAKVISVLNHKRNKSCFRLSVRFVSVPELIKDILNERNQTTVDSKRRNLP